MIVTPSALMRALLWTASCWALLAVPTSAQLDRTNPFSSSNAQGMAAKAGSQQGVHAAMATDVYSVDDGIRETELGLTAGGDLMFMNAFNATPGPRWITAILVSWGSVADGRPERVILYEDPTNDGNPTDAVRLVSVSVETESANTGTFVRVPIPATLVDGWFFVAAAVAHPALEYPAPIDQSSSNMASWVVGDGTSLNVDNLALNDIPPGLIAGFNFPGNWLLRAEGDPFVYGDISGDGITTFGMEDVRAFLMLRSLGAFPLPASVNPAADVTGDGDIDVFDLVFMVLRLQNRVTCFPAEPGCIVPPQYQAYDRKAAEAPVFAWSAPTRAEDGTYELTLELVSGFSSGFYLEIPASKGVDIRSIESSLPADWWSTTFDGEGTRFLVALGGETPLLAGNVVRIRATAPPTGEALVHATVGDAATNHTQDLAPANLREADLPSAFRLDVNYPNPFNPSTLIRFALPEAADVELSVFDLAGRIVATLAAGPMAAGEHEVTFRADQVPSGVYLYRLKAGAYEQTRQMVLTK